MQFIVNILLIWFFSNDAVLDLHDKKDFKVAWAGSEKKVRFRKVEI